MKLTVAGYCIIIQGCQYFSPPRVAKPNALLWCRVWACICKLLNLSKNWFGCPRKKKREKKVWEKAVERDKSLKVAYFLNQYVWLYTSQGHDKSLTVTMKKEKLPRFTKNVCFEVCSIKRDRYKSLLSSWIPLEKVFLSCVKFWHLILVAFSRYTTVCVPLN